MLRTLFLSDFRGFSGFHEIPLGKLTLLYGPNSSGKSSVLKALNLLASGDEDRMSPLFSLPFSRDGFANGTYRSTVNQQDPNKNIGIGYEAETPDLLLSSYRASNRLCLFCTYSFLPADSQIEHDLPVNESENWLSNVLVWSPRYGTEHRLSLEIGPPSSQALLDLVHSHVSPLNDWDSAVREVCEDPLVGELSHGHTMVLKDIDSFVELLKRQALEREEAGLAAMKDGLEEEYSRELGELSDTDRDEDSTEWASWRNEPIRAFYDDWTKQNPGESEWRARLVASYSARPRVEALERPELRELLAHSIWSISRKKRGNRDAISITIPSRHVLRLVPDRDPQLLLALEIIAGFVQSLNMELLTQVAFPAVLGPLRTQPRRFVIERELSLRGRDPFSSFPFGFRSEAQVRQTNRWLEKLNLPMELEIHEEQHEYAGPIYTPLLVHKHTGLKHTFAEVGFGLSQLIPILGADAIQKELDLDRLIYVEQPETHLHPRLQADLVDFFVARATDTDPTTSITEQEDQHSRSLMDRERTSQWIVETHSEAMMLRLQRRIREGRVSPKDVKVVYIGYIEGQGSVVQEMRLADDGEFIDEWPDGFFEDGFDDIFDLGLK